MIPAMSGDVHDEYENPLATRYAGPAMRRLFSAAAPHPHVAPALDPARGGREGPRVSRSPSPSSPSCAAGLESIDFDAAAKYEARFRHDVMAHVHGYGDVAPGARGILHLGATSCYVTDNADAILVREALGLVEVALAETVAALAAFAAKHRDTPCLAYTHFQPAQPTTVGKRACLWILDLLDDLRRSVARSATCRSSAPRAPPGRRPRSSPSSTATRRRWRRSTRTSRAVRASRPPCPSPARPTPVAPTGR